MPRAKSPAGSKARSEAAPRLFEKLNLFRRALPPEKGVAMRKAFEALDDPSVLPRVVESAGRDLFERLRRSGVDSANFSTLRR
jgi:hypothetical protein